MLEVKADGLEASFEAFQQDEAGVAALKAELDALKERVADGSIAAKRPALDGVKSAGLRDFVDRGGRGLPPCLRPFPSRRGCAASLFRDRNCMTFSPKFADLVRNGVTVDASGAVTLGSAVPGFTGLAQALSVGDQFYYSLANDDRPNEREVGRGQLFADGQVERAPISGAPVAFSSGAKSISLVAAAEYYRGASGEAVREGTSPLPASPAALFAAAAPVELAPARTVTPDFSAGINFNLTLTGDTLIADPAGAKPGQSGRLRIAQDSAGGRKAAFGDRWQFAGGMPALSEAPGAAEPSRRAAGFGGPTAAVVDRTRAGRLGLARRGRGDSRRGLSGISRDRFGQRRIIRAINQRSGIRIRSRGYRRAWTDADDQRPPGRRIRPVAANHSHHRGMTMTDSIRLRLPLLAPGQLQKDFTHNEALARLDLAVAAAVLEVGRNAPPTSPGAGDCYVIGGAPTGEWAGQARALAGFTESGWRFVAAVAGMQVLDRSQGCLASFDGIAWSVGDVRGKKVSVDGVKVVGAQAAAIVNHPTDTTVNAILAALRAHGLIAS